MSNSISKIKKAVIREDLIAITGDFRKAVILNQFIYWSGRVSDADKFIEKENEIARNHGEEERDPFYGWIYKSADELAEEIMLGVSASQVRRYIKELVDMKFLSKRNNPKYKWDRTLQYRVNLVNIAKALKEKGYPLSDYKIELSDDLSITHPCTISDAPMENQSVQDDRAIPETTNRDYNSNITDTDNEDFNKSFIKDQNTLPEGKDYQTSAISEIPFIPPRTEEQKITRYNAAKKKKEDYSDAELPTIIKSKFQAIGQATNSFQHEIELGTILTLRFFARYEEYRGEKHPMISDEQVSKILDALYNPDSQMAKDEIEDDEEIRYYLEMIEEHFRTNWGKNNNGEFDYRIMLFFGAKTQDMLYNRVKQKWNE